MFLGAHVLDDRAIVIIDQMAAVTIHHVDVISGAQTADVSGWDCFRNGENN